MIEHTDQVSRLEKELEEVKSRRDDLFIKNVALEKENAKLVEEIKALKAAIMMLCDEIEEDI